MIPRATVIVNWKGSPHAFESERVEGDGPFWSAVELTMHQAFSVAELVERIKAADAGKTVPDEGAKEQTP